MDARDLIRGATVGAKKEFARRTVLLTDPTKPFVTEEPVLDANGFPLLDDDYKPVVLRKTLFHPLLDVEGHQVRVELKQPSLKERASIIKAAKALSADASQVDLAALFAEAVVRLSYVPGTEVRVFNDADKESMLNSAPGSYVDQLGPEALKLLNVDSEAVEKNSAGTASGGSSTP